MNDWIEINVSWRDFISKNLNNAGTMVEVNGQSYLIGDINTNGGVCDDCMSFEYDAIVSRYKVLDISGGEANWKANRLESDCLN